MLRRFLSHRTKSRSAARPKTFARFRVEMLEARDVPSVTLAPIADQEMASNRPFFLPIQATTSLPAGTVTHQVTEDSPNLTATVLGGNRSVKFTVTGGSGAEAFTGTFTIQLFEQTAPNATQRVIDLINSGFYNGKLFFRITDLFQSSPGVPDTKTNIIIQGGGLNNTQKSSLPDFADEFNADFTFASNGLVAMANSGPDSNNAQFFISDLNRPLAERIEFLNYRHTIIGIITDGFDTIQKMQAVPKRADDPSAPQDPITIVNAEVLNVSPHGVVMFTPVGGGFTGSAAVTITSNDADGSATRSFTLRSAVSVVNSAPFLGPLSQPLTTRVSQPVTFTIPVVDPDGGSLVYAVRDEQFLGPVSNATVQIDQATGQVTITPTAGFTGTIRFRIGVQDPTADNTSFDTEPVVLNVSERAEQPGPITAVGSAAGEEPRVRVFNADGTEKLSFLAYEPGFRGGVIVAVADVTGDGKPDVVAVPGFGGSPLIKVFDSDTGTLLFSRMIFEDTFRGGLNLAVGDATGAGRSQILVGAGVSGGPRVTLLDVADNRVVMNYFAHDFMLRGGVWVGLAELKAGFGRDIVTSPGPGGGPILAVFDPTTGNLLGEVFVGNPNDRRGLQFRIGDPVGDGTRRIFAFVHGTNGTQGETEIDPTTFADFEGGGIPFLGVGDNDDSATRFPPGLFG